MMESNDQMIWELLKRCPIPLFCLRCQAHLTLEDPLYISEVPFVKAALIRHLWWLKKTFLIFSCNCQKISLALKALLWVRLFKTTLPLFDRCRRRRWRRRRKGHGINGRRPTRPVPALGTPVVTIESIQRSGTDQLDLDATALVFYRTSRPHGLTSQIWEILMGLSSSVYSSLVPLESWS